MKVTALQYCGSNILNKLISRKRTLLKFPQVRYSGLYKTVLTQTTAEETEPEAKKFKVAKLLVKNLPTSRTFSRNVTFVSYVSVKNRMRNQNHFPVFFGQNFKATILNEDASRDRSFHVVIGE